MNAIVGDKIMSEVMNVTEYEPTFNTWRFFKIFMYHIGFFIFGILMALVIVIVDGYQFTCNMGFIGMKSIRLIVIQYMQHFAFTSSIIAFYLWDSKMFDFSEFLFPFITIITRSFIIGIRYGYMSESRYAAYNMK